MPCIQFGADTISYPVHACLVGQISCMHLAAGLKLLPPVP